MAWFVGGGVLWFLGGGLVALLVGGILAALHYEKKRAEAWQAAAEKLGYRFVGKGLPTDVPGSAQFKLFDKGSSRTVKNLVTGTEGDATVTLCDYQYTTGSGKNRTTHAMTVCVIDTGEVSLPVCLLRPEVRLFDFLGRMFGGQDINFDGDPAFSSAYVLQGDEAPVRAVFSDAVRAFFADHRTKGWMFEAAGRRLCLHHGKRLEPDKISGLVADAVEILEVFKTW